MDPLPNQPVDLRQIELSSHGLFSKLNLILRSFQLSFFTSGLSIVSFMLIGISKLIIRENTKPDVPNPQLQLFEGVFNSLAFVITCLFAFEIILQLLFGYGLAYLKGLWSLFDTTVVFLLFGLELASHLGWKDPTAGIWRFLIILRMAHLLSLMSEISNMSIAKKRERRAMIEDQIAETQGQMMLEDQRSIKLKEDIRLATLKLKNMEKNVTKDKLDAEVYTRRYSALI